MQKYGYMKMPDICLCPVLPKSMNQAQTVTPALKSNIQIDAKIDGLLLLLPLMSLYWAQKTLIDQCYLLKTNFLSSKNI